ncbi:hypothetical protein MNBD_GAMMA22-889 [hydrothermal vent metagenome]|uniref:ADP-heptose--lipooligosaccharide heptosyltransferase II n=1 Tax=hydrothermal vent metagenome TaxID=652676 RepID=A0A3B1ALN9_9ZZZZ
MLNNQTANSLLKSQHPVLLFANGHGDHYLNLPTIRALAKLFSGKLILVGIKDAINQIAGDLTLTKLIGLPMQHNGTGRSFDSNQAATQIGQCDLFISLNPWQSDDLHALIAKLKPQTSIGFFDHYDITVARDYNKHSVDLAFDFVRLFQQNWQPEQFSKPPQYEQKEYQVANKILNSIKSNQKLLCIHPDTLPKKMWPESCWLQLIDKFLDQNPDYTVFIIGLKGIDASLCQNHKSVIPAYRLPISVSAILLSKADLFIGVDSVFLHIADLYRVLTVALFSPTSTQEWGIRFGSGIHIHEKSGMDKLSVERVFNKINYLVARPNTKKYLHTIQTG